MRCVFRVSEVISIALCIWTMVLPAAAQQPASGDTSKKPIAQKCLDDIQAFDEQLRRVGFGVLLYYPGVSGDPYGLGTEPTPRKKLRALFDAATVYAYSGDEQLCEQTLVSMRAVYDQHQKLIGSEADDPDIATAWRRAHLARSKPVAGMNHLMLASLLIGAEIRNLNDDRLGEITDIILNPAKQDILYVTATRGGFLGFGEKLLAVRWADLRATDDHELYVLDVTPKALADAPALNRRNFAETADPAWQHSLAQYWDSVLKK